jgi:hypothetical protein
MERLRNRFLNVPVDTVLHSVSVSAQQVSTEQKHKAANARPVVWEGRSREALPYPEAPRVLTVIDEDAIAISQTTSMGKALSELFTKAIETPASLLILSGVAIFIFSITGGFAFKDFSIATVAGFQFAGAIVGALLITVGVIRVWTDPPSTKPYVIRIIYPAYMDKIVGKTEVRGEIKKMPPRGYELWILRIHGRGEFVPVKKVDLWKGNQIWIAAGIDVGDKGGWSGLSVCLVPTAAKALFDYFYLAAERHNDWMESLQVDLDARNRYLPQT